MSHFASIGFFDARQELGRLFDTEPDDVFVDGTGASHGRFVDEKSGAAVIVHMFDNEIVCTTPFFVAGPEASLWHARHEGACIDSDCVHCSGVDVDIFDPRDAPRSRGAIDRDDFVARATVQLIHGAARHPRAPLDGVIAARPVVAFAHDVTSFEDAHAFLASQGEREHKFAPRSFFPLGMFGPPAGPGSTFDVTARASALFTGQVLRSGIRRNRWTDASFLHFVIDCFFGPIDVVADAREHEQPARGAFTQVRAWLVAE